MPIKGEVRVHMTARTATAAAEWLVNDCLPQLRLRPDTLLTPGWNRDLEQTLTPLVAILSKAAARKRTAILFTINVPRNLVEAFVAAATPMRGVSYRSVRRASVQFRAALRSSRGRPKLSRSARVARVSGHVAIENRHRKRIARTERHQAVWNAWSQEVAQRGETLLSTTLPYPEI